MATVVAAVDLARVRQPVHAEGGEAEEKHIAPTQTLPAEAAALVQVSQVGGAR